MNFEEKQIESKTVYAGKIIDVEVMKVELPNGKMATRDIVRHMPAVAVLAINNENKMILMKQWRAPIDALTLEIPAGKLDDRDQGDMLGAINRELNEETRCRAGKISEINSFYTAIGFSDEYMTLYLATELEPVQNELPQDDDENLEMITVTLDQALMMVNSKEIVDQKTIMAIYYWATIKQGE